MVFSTLMSSLDYMDAAHNLMQLKLNDVQRREVIRVLVHCLSNVRMRVSRPIHSFIHFFVWFMYLHFMRRSAHTIHTMR